MLFVGVGAGTTGGIGAGGGLKVDGGVTERTSVPHSVPLHRRSKPGWVGSGYQPSGVVIRFSLSPGAAYTESLLVSDYGSYLRRTRPVWERWG